MNRRAFAAIVCGILIGVPVGCSGKKEVDTVAASGTVTYKGDPVANATVVFNPVTSGPLAIGVTDDNGKFTLKTNKIDGAKPGDYKITVAPKTEETPMPGTKEAAEAAKKKKQPSFPDKFRRVESTTLKETVSASGTNEFELNLDK